MPRKIRVLATLTALALTACTQTTEPTSTPPRTSSDSHTAIGTSNARDTCGAGECVSLLFTGDFLMHNMLWAQAQLDAQTQGKTGLDFRPLIAEQKPYLDQTDLAVCQMETPVAPEEGPYLGYPAFNVPPQILTAAAETGWDACMTASNHSIDQGTEGLERTYQTIQRNGMGVTGTNLTKQESQEPDIFTSSNGAKIAVITGTYGLNGNIPEHSWQIDMLDTNTMIAKAKKARAQGADLVVANIHAGDEYVHKPNKQQVTTAHALVDSEEFDIIVGQHAHAVQPIEKYKDTWIVYGMGNNLTELSPIYEANNEGIMVNPIFKHREDGTWYIQNLRWVSSKIVDTPGYRYCITSPNRPATDCIDPASAYASNTRVQEIVESMGAAEEGASQWE